MRYTTELIVISVIPILCIIFLHSCAVPRAPTGGDKDIIGPILLFADPPSGTVNFDSKSITLKFNEYIKDGDLNTGIFISPIPPKRPEIYVINKKLKIILSKDFQDSVTYVISINNSAIKDYNEGNPLSKPLQFAFSKGDQIDSSSVSGMIFDSYSNKPVKYINVSLFNPDSILGNDYRQKLPSYVSQTDSNGIFTLNFIKPGNYRIFAYKDIDQNYRYNLPNEGVGLLSDSTYNLNFSNDFIKLDSVINGLELKYFLPDTIPPKVKNVSWLNSRNLKIEFNEPVLKGKYIDHNKKEISLIDQRHFGREHFIVHLDQVYSDTFEVVLNSLEDTTGNKRDTTLNLKFLPEVKPNKMDTVTKEENLSFRMSESFRTPFERTFYLSSPVEKNIFDKYLSFVDSSGKKIKHSIEIFPYYIYFKPDEKLDTLMKYKIVVDSLLSSIDGFYLSKKYEDSYFLPSLANYCHVKGTIEYKSDSIILLLQKAGDKNLYRSYGKVFNFPYLPTGEYSITIIDDQDGNGEWTTGSVLPRRNPERVFYPDKKIIANPNDKLYNQVIKLN